MRVADMIPILILLSSPQVRMGDRSSDEAKMARRVLVYVFDTCLRLLHPFMPFVTEVSSVCYITSILVANHSARRLL